jgi:UDP-N-acetyl-2-amino-2-deoxyglucuronate dehydrogenase
MKEAVFGIGIVGAGVIARVHAEVIGRIEQARLVAVCSPKPESAQRFAEQFNCAWYSDLLAMLRNPDIHIVVLCTPSGLHGEQAILCAEAGKHILTEKPIDIGWQQAINMISSCRSHNVKLAVVSQHRFQPDVIRAKSLIDANRLGSIIAANASMNWYRTQEYYDSASWRGTWEWDGGGALMNQGIHTVDLLQYLAGSVHSVYAQCRTAAHERIAVEDVAALTLQYKHGAIGTLFASTGCYPGLQSRIEIFGQNGTIILENNVMTGLHLKDQTEDEQFNGTSSAELMSSTPALAVSDMHLAQYMDLIEAIVHDRAPSIHGGEGVQPLAIVLAAYQSAKCGHSVQVDEIGTVPM